MTAELSHKSSDSVLAQRLELSEKYDGIAWALGFIWIGLAVLLNIGWGWGLLGIAAIILGETALRWNEQLNIESFRVVVGLLFLVGGFWELFAIPWPMAPVLIIGCGMVILFGALSGQHMLKKRRH